jgi:hypothetical protein
VAAGSASFHSVAALGVPAGIVFSGIVLRAHPVIRLGEFLFMIAKKSARKSHEYRSSRDIFCASAAGLLT